MASGNDSTDGSVAMDDHRRRLQGMREKLPDENYENIVLRALSTYLDFHCLHHMPTDTYHTHCPHYCRTYGVEHCR